MDSFTMVSKRTTNNKDKKEQNRFTSLKKFHLYQFNTTLYLRVLVCVYMEFFTFYHQRCVFIIPHLNRRLTRERFLSYANLVYLGPKLQAGTHIFPSLMS